MAEGIKYSQFGARICIPCNVQSGALELIHLDMDDTKALGREVRKCQKCETMAIGEKPPPSLQKFFDDEPEDDILLEYERIPA